MSDVGELSLSAVRHKRAQSPSGLAPERATIRAHERRGPVPPIAPVAQNESNKTVRRSILPFDPRRLAMALKLRRRWLAGAAAGFAVVAFCVGYFKSNYTVRLTLIGREAATAFAAGPEGEAYRPRLLTPQTLVSLMGSPELLRRVAAKVRPSLPPDNLPSRAEVAPVRETDLVALTVAGKDRTALVDLANVYASEAVQLGKELQTADASRLEAFYRAKLSALDGELKQVSDELVQFQKEARLMDPDAERQTYIKQLGDIVARADNARIEAEMADLQVTAMQAELAQQSPIAQKLQAARSKLTDLFARYTEAHPFVETQRKEIAGLEKQLAAAGTEPLSAPKFNDNSLGGALYLRLVELQTRKLTLQKETQELARLRGTLQEKMTGLSEKTLRYANLKAQVEGLQKSRALLAHRQREVQLYTDNAEGYYRVFTPATINDVDASARWRAGFLAALGGLLIGVLGAGLVITGREISDGRLKTVVDVERATGLPVLATLGDLDKMSQKEKASWAFRAWTALSGQLNASPNHGLVCGIISSTSGEGRSTWINLLANAARQRGLQAYTVATQATQPTPEPPAPTADEGLAGLAQTAGVCLAATRPDLPASVTSLSPPAAHIPLPGSIWNLERRKEWQSALTNWRAMDNLVLFIELPPASVPEAVLLAENLPQVIWLADSGKADARATRQHLETLRHAKCRLVGAVLNHEAGPVF